MSSNNNDNNEFPYCPVPNSSVDQIKGTPSPMSTSKLSKAQKEEVVIPPNKYGVAIKIVDHYNKENGWDKHTIYTIKGHDSTGALFEVYRRYSEFVVLRQVLLRTWPCCFIPPLPPKNVLNKMAPAFIQERMSYLNLFLTRIAENTFLFTSKEFQTFIKYAGVDLKRELKTHEALSLDEIITRYASTFQHLSQVSSPDEAATIIGRFKALLIKLSGRFKIFKQISKEAIEAKKNYYRKMGRFHNDLLAEYEKDIMSEYHRSKSGKLVFVGDEEGQLREHARVMGMSSTNASIEHFDVWFNTEARDVEALLEAIKQKEGFELRKSNLLKKSNSLSLDIVNINNGKFYWKALFSGKEKEEVVVDLQKDIDRINKEIEQLTMIIDMSTLILAYDEIELFKADKADKFYDLTNHALQNELDNLYNLVDYWNLIKKNNTSNMPVPKRQ